ncbi:hypothetical protein GCM10027256_24450 [Novispirillum itersonii subsp. nipponicum]
MIMQQKVAGIQGVLPGGAGLRLGDQVCFGDTQTAGLGCHLCRFSPPGGGYPAGHQDFSNVPALMQMASKADAAQQRGRCRAVRVQTGAKNYGYRGNFLPFPV